MKKTLILVGMLAVGYANAQYDGKVGINTDKPKATLDLNVADVNKDKTTNEGILAPRLSKTRVANITAPVEGTLVYVTNDTDSPISAYTGNDTKVEKITQKGYYYYNGTQWINNNATNENIYNTSGELSDNRIIEGNGKDFTIRGLKDFIIQSDKGTISTSIDRETERPTIVVGDGDLKVNNFLKVTRNATVEGSVQAHLLRASNLVGVHDRPVVATPNGILKIADGPTGTGINIYNDDGTLLGNRIVNNNGKTLTFTNNSSFKINTTSTNDKYFEVQDVQITTNLPYESTSIVSAKNLRATSLAGTGNRLVIADANGTLKLGTETSVSGANIYNANGTLTGDRTVNGNGKNLIIRDLNGFYLQGSTFEMYDYQDTYKSNNKLRTLFVDATQFRAKNLLTGGAIRVTSFEDSTATNDRPVVVDKDGLLKIGTATDTSIYTNDGTLSGTRTVNTNGNNLSFTGAGKIGIGVATPTQKLDVDGSIKSSSLKGTGDRNVVASADGTLKIGNPVPNVRWITTGYSADLLESDNGGFVYVNTSADFRIDILKSLPVGFSCVVVRYGTGNVTIGSGAGMSSPYAMYRSARGQKLRAQYSAVGIIKQDASYFTITGDAVE